MKSGRWRRSLPVLALLLWTRVKWWKHPLSRAVVMLFVSLSASWVVADEPLALLGEAEKAYHQEQFEQAREYYLRLVKRGGASGAVLYNLATVELRRGEVGWAVLFYRRAALLLPRDGDVRENLQLARAGREGAQGIDHEGGLTAMQLLALPRLLLSQNEAEWCLLILVAVFSAGSWGVVFRNLRWAQWFVVAAGGVAVWFVADLTFAAYDGRGRPTWRTASGVVPVVFVRSARLLQAPAETAAPGREVPAGSEVLAWFPGGEWVKILGPEEGWVRGAGSEPVIARVQ